MCLQEASEELTVSDANSAWLARRYRLQPQYSQALQAAFGAAAAPLTSAAAVNDWVSKATRGKIQAVIDEAMVQQVCSLTTCEVITPDTYVGA
jgi:serine protease inhibitor